MRSSFGARRQARKVGQEEDDDDEGQNVRYEPGGQEQESTSIVIRPQLTSRGSSKTKKRSSLRVSFGPSGTSMTEDDDDAAPTVFTPKKSNLSRQAVKKNALRKSLASSLASEHLPFRQTDERPSYSADHLNELKTSTPSTPKDLRSRSDEEGKALDLVSKFGTDLMVQDFNSAIPTDAEIREKKERRARLAKEQDYINLSDNNTEEEEEHSNDSNDETSLLPYAQKQKPKRPETRLVRDDEDIAEGFDEFVSDGRIALGKKAEREQKRRHDAEMRDMINEAEGGDGSDDSEEDESEAERKAAYEAAQTRKGMDGLHRGEDRVKPRRPRTPPRITPLPTLAGCIEKMKARVEAMQYQLMLKRRRMEEIEKERADIKVREEEIQRLLKETGERYERLRREAGLGAEEPPHRSTSGLGNGQMVGLEGMGSRGLENLADV